MLKKYLDNLAFFGAATLAVLAIGVPVNGLAYLITIVKIPLWAASIAGVVVVILLLAAVKTWVERND